MPRKSQKSGIAVQPGMMIPPELLDPVVKGPMTAEEVQSVSLSFKKALIERAMGAELSPPWGTDPGRPNPRGSITTATAAPARRS